jgi:RNA-directed DNA polymerase
MLHLGLAPTGGPSRPIVLSSGTFSPPIRVNSRATWPFPTLRFTQPEQTQSVFWVAKFGLELHPEKTRLIEFGRFAAQNRKRRGEGKPETFTFLGFTHYCGKRRKDGAFTVWRATAKKRMAAKLLAIKAELIRRQHEPPASVGEWLQKVVAGYYRYHAVPGNLPQLWVFRHRLRRLWRTVLIHRSQRGYVGWERLAPLFDRWIPHPRVLHPYPIQRFEAIHSRWKPYA